MVELVDGAHWPTSGHPTTGYAVACLRIVGVDPPTGLTPAAFRAAVLKLCIANDLPFLEDGVRAGASASSEPGR